VGRWRSRLKRWEGGPGHATALEAGNVCCQAGNGMPAAITVARRRWQLFGAAWARRWVAVFAHGPEGLISGGDVVKLDRNKSRSVCHVRQWRLEPSRKCGMSLAALHVVGAPRARPGLTLCSAICRPPCVARCSDQVQVKGTKGEHKPPLRAAICSDNSRGVLDTVHLQPIIAHAFLSSRAVIGSNKWH
jgi:hypothetical protein